MWTSPFRRSPAPAAPDPAPTPDPTAPTPDPAPTADPGPTPDPTPADEPSGWPAWVAYEPALLPPPALMGEEGIAILEEWYRWAEEWSMLLRVYGRLGMRSRVLEIGCGAGRIAFALRYLLMGGRYDGFDIRRAPIDFLQGAFQAAHPNFRFHHADLRNTFYNPEGRLETPDYAVPATGGSIDLAFASSVFTHMLPRNARHYFGETARVLAPEGRAVFSFFLLDHYRAGRPRPFSFGEPDFDFDHGLDGEDEGFALVDPANPERMTAYRLDLVRRLAAEAGLEVEGEPVPGLWSGAFDAPVGAQDVVVLRRAGAAAAVGRGPVAI